MADKATREALENIVRSREEEVREEVLERELLLS